MDVKSLSEAIDMPPMRRYLVYSDTGEWYTRTGWTRSIQEACMFSEDEIRCLPQGNVGATFIEVTTFARKTS